MAQRWQLFVCVALVAALTAAAGAAAAEPFVAGDYEAYRGTPFNVSWDSRAFTINGGRKLLLSGGIHYPRSTPAMWPRVLRLMRDAGLNTIETYVFWNYHEPLYRQYDFETGSHNLRQFLQNAKDAGLYVILRVGPYVCAEWNYGGVPVWTRQMGMTIRTNDTKWEYEMETFFKKVVEVVEPFLAKNGGPIILTQVENEYGDIMKPYGAGGEDYLQWCVNMALGLNTSTVWIMCRQTNAPAGVVDTLNGFYTDNDLADHFAKKHTPGGYTELWSGWFQKWGEASPHRPTTDLAFSVARFVQRGGTMVNYYMFYGGTNFGRVAGGPYIVTSYDYDVHISENGVPAEPKYRHLATLHKLLAAHEAELVLSDVPAAQSLGSNQEAHQYGSLLFIANWDTASAGRTVTYQPSVTLTLPPWSVSLYNISNPAQPQLLYSTAQVAPKTLPAPVVVVTSPTSAAYAPDVLGGCAECAHTKATAGPIEQTAVTNDTTDYLWHVVPVHVDAAGVYGLSIAKARNYVYVFLDGVLKYSVMKWDAPRTVNIVVPFAGTHLLQILTLSMGLDNYGHHYDQTSPQGLVGPISFGAENLTLATWTQINGTKGELFNWFLPGAAVPWLPVVKMGYLKLPNTPLTWHKLTFPLAHVLDNATYALDLSPMGKGAAYVNGHHIGRYWDIVVAPAACDSCSSSSYNGDGCRTNCGEPSQSLYHVPRDWLVAGDNSVVLFEETNNGDNDPMGVTLREVQLPQ